MPPSTHTLQVLKQAPEKGERGLAPAAAHMYALAHGALSSQARPLSPPDTPLPLPAGSLPDDGRR